jgi:hypothetical protein
MGSVQSFHEVQQCQGRISVQVSSGFISQDQGRFSRDRPGNGDSLLLASRELERAAVLHPFEANFRQNLPNLRLPLSRWDPPEQKNELRIFFGAEDRHQVEGLKDKANLVQAQSSLLFGSLLRNVLPV